MISDCEILYEKKGKKVIFKKNEGSLIYLDNNVYCSGIFPDEVFKNSFWTVPASVALTTGMKKILLLGGGGGGMAQIFSRMNTNAHIDVVDIDGDVVDIFELFCNFCHTKTDNINLIIEDACNYIKETDKVYDFVVVDIFCENRIIDSVSSLEFWQQINKIVSNDGIVVFNTKMRNWFFENEADNPLYLLLDKIYEVGFKAAYIAPFHSGGWLYICKSSLDLISEIKNAGEDIDNKYLEAAMLANRMYIRHFPPREKSESPTDNISGRYFDYVFAGLVHYGRKRNIRKTEDIEKLFMKEVYINFNDKRRELDAAVRKEYYKELWEALDDNANLPIGSVMLPGKELLSNNGHNAEFAFFKDLASYFCDEKFEIDGIRKMLADA